MNIRRPFNLFLLSKNFSFKRKKTDSGRCASVRASYNENAVRLFSARPLSLPLAMRRTVPPPFCVGEHAREAVS
jgi:hypothetical protein